MNNDTLPRPRPAMRYLVASGLLGFVLGAFVVASLGVGSPLRSRATSSGSPVPIGTESTATGKPTTTGIDEPTNAVVEVPAPTSSASGVIPTTSPEGKDLADRHLDIPVAGIAADKLVHSYHDSRSGGREHEALDILAPRNTPVIAVENGTVAKLFVSKAGGNTIYQFDPGQGYAYYYAHLERYAEGLKEGDTVTRGQVIGYVGTSGNAPKDTPHLHFAIFRLTPEKHWWQGTPVDPFDILR